jgi:hypothetical protein
MKHFKLIILLFAVWTISCESWLDVNQNPDAPVEVSYEELLPAGISSVSYVLGGRYQVLGALWSQHWTQSPGASQYAGLDSYDINSSAFDNNQFGELYSGALQNLEQVRLGALSEGENIYFLIATIMQCYTFQILADLYNQIPFSEALKADLGISEPVYEPGPQVYDSLLARLDYALSLNYTNLELDDPEDKDLVFNGDVNRWIEFANTLKLRIILRLTETNPQKAEQLIVQLYADDPDFLQQSARVEIYSNESGRRNPLYDTEVFTLGGNPNLILSNTLHNYLNSMADFKRVDYLFTRPDAGGSHKSLIQGDFYAPEESAGINSSSYSKPRMNPTAAVNLLSLPESNLLQAEAIIRYNVDDYQKARELYNEAVLEAYKELYQSIKEIDLQEAESNANRMLNSAYVFPAEGSLEEVFIEAIAMQKWISLSGIQNLEAFFELNRTGYPKKSNVPADNPEYVPGELSVSVNNVTSGRFPKRLIFPESEYSNNRNTPERKDVWENIWWDIN